MNTDHAIAKAPAAWREWALAARVGWWLLVLPLRLRFATLPGLLAQASERRPKRPGHGPFPAARLARVVRRVAKLPLFNLPLFPLICLRQSLALFWILRGYGYPCRFHLGTLKEGSALAAHAWVSLYGEVLLEHNGQHSGYRHLYSYPREPADLDSLP